MPDKKQATRTETDSFGAIEVPADRYWGAQSERSLENFPIGWEKQPAPIVRALGIIKRAAAEVNMDLGKLDPDDRRGHRQGGAGGGRGQARRPLPAGRLADRLRHAIQHERQRGDRQPRHRDPRRHHRLEDAGPSQRPRQHEPVVQRHLPDGHAHRLRRGDRAPPVAGAAEAAQRAQRQGAGLRQDHQDRPHPHPGRHAADARPGVLRLHPAGRERHRAHRDRRCRG